MLTVALILRHTPHWAFAVLGLAVGYFVGWSARFAVAYRRAAGKDCAPSSLPAE